MKRILDATTEKHRIRSGIMASNPSAGNNGAFILWYRGKCIRVIVSDGAEWEHVSVSVGNQDRCPTWEEMCFIKDKFWTEEEEVMQFHPAKSKHVNCHPYCLHLWRPRNGMVPMPPEWMIGPKEVTGAGGQV